MRFGQYLKVLNAITVISVIYIHMQMEIIALAYQGKDRERQIKRLIEENGNITYDILVTKSVQNLGVKMLAEGTKMQFMDAENIVPLSTPPGEYREHDLRSEQIKKQGGLLSLLKEL